MNTIPIVLFNKTIEIKYNDCVPKGTKQTYFDSALTLYIHMNNVCNAKCEFCNVHRNQAQNSNIDLNKLSEVLIELSEAKRVGRIAITGGEPLLDIKSLDNVLGLIKSIITDPVVTLNTNGTMLYKLSELTNIVVLTEIRISRHHFFDEVNDEIFGVKCASVDEIHKLIIKYGSGKIKLNCNLIKGYVDSEAKIESYLDEVGMIGIRQVGFVNLMPMNGYCRSKFVDYTKFKFPDSFLKIINWHDLDICKCENYLYSSRYVNEDIRMFFRKVKTVECQYCRQFVYTYDNKLISGFNGKVIY